MTAPNAREQTKHAGGNTGPSPTIGPSGLYELRHGTSDRTHLVGIEAIAGAGETTVETAHGTWRALSVVALCGQRIVTTSTISTLGVLCVVCQVRRLLIDLADEQSPLPQIGNPHTPPYRPDAVGTGPFDEEPVDLFPIVHYRADGTVAANGETASNSAGWMAAALQAAGVEMGAFDRFVVATLAREGWSVVQTVHGWLTRAHHHGATDDALAAASGEEVQAAQFFCDWPDGGSQ